MITLVNNLKELKDEVERLIDLYGEKTKVSSSSNDLCYVNCPLLVEFVYINDSDYIVDAKDSQEITIMFG